MINKHVLDKPCDGEPKVFFVNMVGHYNRYIAENAKGSNLGELFFIKTQDYFFAATVDSLTESLRKKDLLGGGVIGTDNDGCVW